MENQTPLVSIGTRFASGEDVLIVRKVLRSCVMVELEGRPGLFAIEHDDIEKAIMKQAPAARVA